ncbi:MAG: hypothetical protein KC505_07010 [Myxococcales bacterium]|nr:hypothetical protein [Myxococcales bacterium]USN50509.1 MAG: hypothetical protein H6731_09640 [Myxococcales bacterium]
MAHKTFVALSVLFLVILFIFLFRALLRAKDAIKKTPSPAILPDDFLFTIMLFFNLWISLLFLLLSMNLELEDKQNIIIISAIVTPFLFWWWRKKSEKKI